MKFRLSPYLSAESSPKLPDMHPNSFDKFFDTPQHNKLKLVKYPAPPSDAAIPKVGVFRSWCSQRTAVFLHFFCKPLLTLDSRSRTKNGDWVKASTNPWHTGYKNIGRSLQALTKGVCTATTHRVNLSPENYVSTDGAPLGPSVLIPGISRYKNRR